MANSEATAADPMAALLAEAKVLVESDPALALQKLRAGADVEPDHPEALRLAGAALRKLGEWSRAARADGQVVLVLSRAPELMDAKRALDERQVGVAERLLKTYLQTHRNNPAAMSMLAGLAEKIGRLPEAEALLQRTLALLPSFGPARFDLAVLGYRTGRYQEALAEIETLLAAEPERPDYLNLKASVLSTLGRLDEALAIYEDVTARFPEDGKIWIQFGNQLRAVGRQDESVSAYRRALALDPSFGPVWWSLANLKTVKLDAGDIALMSVQLAREDLPIEDRIHIQFALGKAWEDAGDFAAAFERYAEGNRLHRSTRDYDTREFVALMEASEATFTRDFFETRKSCGAAHADPIFVVGMPRSGSTLVEQILSSHPQVEGTAELSYIPAMAMELRARPGGYPACLHALEPAECKALGDRYLASTRSHRRTGRPHFIDKNPNNWMHAGLIHLILPNAKIIDIRRHPLGCGLSNFRQLFARGQRFSYSLEDMGRYYAGYVRLMRHLDEVLPGRVHRVIYEDMVDDLETQVRSMLDYLGLDFSPSCLAFHETDRAVRTPSSLQVRRPLNRDGVNSWQPFEPWLEPLKEALGPVLADYRR
jgi:tetratricopeptide (TPR) repeat protein